MEETAKRLRYRIMRYESQGAEWCRLDLVRNRFRGRVDRERCLLGRALGYAPMEGRTGSRMANTVGSSRTGMTLDFPPSWAEMARPLCFSTDQLLD